jgi:hypothetical protein
MPFQGEESGREPRTQGGALGLETRSIIAP